MGFNVMVILLGVMFLAYGFVSGEFGVENRNEKRRKKTKLETLAVKTIKSEDGDVIDCIDIYNQPAFDHPALRNHTVQMAPSVDPTMTSEAEEQNKKHSVTVTLQRWRKNGSCPKGTIPIRRIHYRIPSAARKKPNYSQSAPHDRENFQVQQRNHSKALLLTYGYSYHGVKGDIRVWNPNVEHDDEYSTSRVSLLSGPYNDFQTVESGWMVNPGLYGDRKTRLYVYWTADGSKKTGCFDMTCPGFIQTSSEIAIGAAIYPISVPCGLPYQITLYIFRDPSTGNWWVQYGEKFNVGYFPRNLFKTLGYHAESVEWGGEVYSSTIGHTPHTKTAMGNGRFPDYITGDSGSIKRLRIRDNSRMLKIPEWAFNHVDEYNCYGADYIVDYVEDPEFYYGGPGHNYKCP